MNTVLVVGYGKIGRYKAQVYRELGYQISIVDTDPTSKAKSIADASWYSSIADVELRKFNVVDICTPTKTHIEVFEQLIQYFPTSLFVIEKPLCSSAKELSRFEFLLRHYPDTMIIYSENYIFSSAISEVSRLLVENGLVMKEITMEFSKNRITDIENGRFLDMELEGFGIEAPHMLMIVNRLGHSLTSITKVRTRDLKCGGSRVIPRQGEIEVCAMLDKNIPFTFYQSMAGKMLFQKEHFVLPNTAVNRSNRYRVLYLKCNKGYEIFVQFEPINGQDRFISRVTFVNKGEIIETFDVEDNTLRYILKHVDDVVQKRITRNKYLSPQYAIRVTNVLLKLKELSMKDGLPVNIEG